MKDSHNIDLGSVKIHDQVIVDITVNALKDVKGLKLFNDTPWGKVQEFLGLKKYPAIVVSQDKNGQKIINVNVSVHYGLNISEVAAQAQDFVRDAIERTGDIDLKDVNINVRGIERGDS